MNLRTLFGIILSTATLSLSACASFDIGNANRDVDPGQAAKSLDLVNHGDIAWGGVIVNGKNLSDSTELEVLAYPLDSNNRPSIDEKPTGRFIAVKSGYLEVADYAPGREITIVGKVHRVRDGKVGDAKYTYPILEAQTLNLWSKERGKSDPQLHFGFGISVIH